MTESVHGISKKAFAVLEMLAGPGGKVIVDEQAQTVTIIFSTGAELQMDIPNPTIN